MTMNLGGYEVQLYDQQGNPVMTPEELAAEDMETKQVRNLVTQINSYIDEIENVGANLECGPDVNIYSPVPESGFDRPYYSVSIYGGLNGRGIWSNYLKALYDLLLRLEADYEDVWMIELPIDVTDDVFTVCVGIYPYEGQLDR